MIYKIKTNQNVEIIMGKILKILGKWAEYMILSVLFEDDRKDHSAMKRNFAGSPFMKHEIRAAIRKMKLGKATGQDGKYSTISGIFRNS